MYQTVVFSLLSIIFLAASVADTLRISRPTIADSLLPLKNSRPRPEGIIVDTIVLHFISNAKETPSDPYRVEDVLEIFKRYKLSSHYLVARDGSIHRLVDDSRAAFHGGKGTHALYPDRKNKINDYSIGIEILAIGTREDTEGILTDNEYGRVDSSLIGYTDEQYRALQNLISELSHRFPEIALDRSHIIGHEEYAPGRKGDPGELFDWDRTGLDPIED